MRDIINCTDTESLIVCVFCFVFALATIALRLFSAFVIFATAQEVFHDVHRHGEDDGRVVLGRDAVQSLQIAQLEGWGTLRDDTGGFLQGPRRFLLALGSNDLTKKKKIFIVQVF